MASELVKRLIEANENAQQAVSGSDIYYVAAERIDVLESKLSECQTMLESFHHNTGSLGAKSKAEEIELLLKDLELE